MSAPQYTRLFQALWCAAVLATHRPCFRAVVDDVAEPRKTHALPALAQRNLERLRANTAALLVHFGMADAHRACQPPPTSPQKAIFARRLTED